MEAVALTPGEVKYGVLLYAARQGRVYRAWVQSIVRKYN